uniref:Uncharacterized protein n=1 Tax=Myotis myotis TaxID=51298 RepID=A0A7J7Z570_MYOMY|nr:hypothetical protein mMyoMyo1_010747 [Myotis myotis]
MPFTSKALTCNKGSEVFIVSAIFIFFSTIPEYQIIHPFFHSLIQSQVHSFNNKNNLFFYFKSLSLKLLHMSPFPPPFSPPLTSSSPSPPTTPGLYHPIVCAHGLFIYAHKFFPLQFNSLFHASMSLGLQYFVHQFILFIQIIS